MTLTRHQLAKFARELCEHLELDPDDVYRLVLYAAHPDETPNRVGPGVLAYLYKRRDGRKYLDELGDPVTEVREFHFLPELR